MTMRCEHLGPVIREAGCNCPAKHVRACAIHKECTIQAVNPKVRACFVGSKRCEDFKEPLMLKPEELTSESPVEQVAELLEHGPVGPWPSGWTGWHNVRDAHLVLLDKEMAKTPNYPERKYHGRGIVSCVNAKPGWSSGKDLKHGYFPGAWCQIKELRRFGCDLPITFCHLGHVEWDSHLTNLVAKLGVTVIDLREWEKTNPFRILAGWETKIAAILACPYEEVMFLDADNIPVRNPIGQFDHPDYRRYGATFWPDLPPFQRKEWIPDIVWRNFGMEPRPNEVDFESGQLMVNKRACWKELQITKWINDHSDYWYQMVFGDKSTFHLAWAKCDRGWALPKQAAGWNGGAILQYGLDGPLLFEHGAQNKPTLEGFPKGRSCLTHPGECYEHLDELRRAWNGKLWYNDQPIGSDAALTASLVGKQFLYKRIGLGERPLRLLDDNCIGRGRDRCEVSWSIVGGVMSVNDIDGKPTMLLQEGADKVWRGAWLEHEKCSVELVPL